MKKKVLFFVMLFGVGLTLTACFRSNSQKEQATILVNEQLPTIIEPDVMFETDPLEYLKTNNLILVSTTTAPFDYTAEQLEANAKECGFEYEVGYFENLVAAFKDTIKTIYTFKYTGESQSPDSYRVTLIPNKFFSARSDFKKDFSLCVGGGEAYPKMMDGRWLMLESSCGTGFMNESELPTGCAEARKVIEPTLKLKTIITPNSSPRSEIIQTETVTELASGQLYTNTVNHYSYLCPGGFNIFDGYDFNSKIKTSECAKNYSDTNPEFGDGISLIFEFVPENISSTHMNGDKLWSEQKLETIKSTPGAKVYQRNSFSGWMSEFPEDGGYIQYIMRRSTDGGYFEISASVALKDKFENSTKEERQAIVNEVIDSFKVIE